MKEMYTKPVAELEKFGTCDVITTSGQQGGGGAIETEDEEV